MIPQAGPQIARDPVSDYRRLASALASRATRLGSRDPESAAQEALRRSLENRKSQPAVAYYFGEESAVGATPEWPLDQLLAWLHGVLQYVVREEQSRVGYRREVSAISISEPADTSDDPLEGMIQRETRAIVADCFATLDRDYRSVLTLRMDGLKYGEIARQMGVNENTVATWVSRGIGELGRRIRKRLTGSQMDGRQ
jgi:RNA polymerase sigma factor (sigma-70 family)